MRDHRRLLPLTALALCAFTACTAVSDDGVDDDDVADTSADVASDARPSREDPVTDTAPDVENPGDTGVDTAPDVAPDTAPDVSPDTAEDVAADTADAPADATDATADVVADTTPTCAEQCSALAETVCVDNATIATCADNDMDGCFELVAVTDCGAPRVCDGGRCADSCTDECSPAGLVCADGTHTATCADIDGDGCLELGAPMQCPDAQVCRGGVCASAPSECLVISEYVEGSSNNKAIELFNCGGSARSLDDLVLCLFSNDRVAPPCSNALPLSGSLGAGETLVVCNPSIADDSDCDLLDTVTNFNGDDRILLIEDTNFDGNFGAGEPIVDAFGTYDDQPSSKIWEDVTYRRCNSAAFDGVSAFDVDAFYTTHALDAFDDLGAPPALGTCD